MSTHRCESVKMNILVLEDDPSRVAKFKRELVGNNVQYTDDVDTAKLMVECNENTIGHPHFDLIFLDHDLGGAHYVNTEEYNNTGSTFAGILADQIQSYKMLRPYVLIHSCNHDGAKNMYSKLRHICNVVVQPFVGLNIEAVLQEALRVKQFHEEN